MAQETEGGLMFDPIEMGNFDAEDEKLNRVLSPGVWTVRIVKASHHQGQKAQYLRWQLEVIDAIDPEDNGMALWHNTPIEGRGKGILHTFCHALGQKYPQQLTPQWVESLYGLELKVQTGIRDYTDPSTGESRTSAEVQKVMSKLNGM